MSYHIAITITDRATGKSHLTDMPDVYAYELHGLTTHAISLHAYLSKSALPESAPDESEPS